MCAYVCVRVRLHNGAQSAITVTENSSASICATGWRRLIQFVKSKYTAVCETLPLCLTHRGNLSVGHGRRALPLCVWLWSCCIWQGICWVFTHVQITSIWLWTVGVSKSVRSYASVLNVRPVFKVVYLCTIVFMKEINYQLLSWCKLE